jgi:hypothetical protein
MSNATELKEKIISTIESKGPTLPIQIAKETGMNTIFSSAFLSELYNEKKIKMSHLRVGSSPVYFIEGQEPQLEKFANYLKSKEKEAFQILKENKFLEDSKLQPAIRVALREIKDFAIPFKKDEEIFWKFFTISDDEIRKILEEPEKQEELEKRKEIISQDKKEKIIEKNENEKKTLDIFDKEPPKKKEPVKKVAKKTTTKPRAKKTTTKKDENFFNKIKEHLANQKIEIIDIINFKNDEAKIKIKKENTEELLFVFNKKKITEKEILKSNKEASEMELKYTLLSFGEITKKLNDFIDAIKNLSEIGKIN